MRVLCLTAVSIVIPAENSENSSGVARPLRPDDAGITFTIKTPRGCQHYEIFFRNDQKQGLQHTWSLSYSQMATPTFNTVHPMAVAPSISSTNHDICSSIPDEQRAHALNWFANRKLLSEAMDRLNATHDRKLKDLATQVEVKSQTYKSGHSIEPSLKLHTWADGNRALPNPILRSSLFTASNERPEVCEFPVEAMKDIEIFYTGMRLNQKDLDYYLELLHLQRNIPLGHPIRFSANSLLNSLGLENNGKQYNELKNVLERLSMSKVKIQYKNKTVFNGPLIHLHKVGENFTKYIVVFSLQTFELFKAGYTQVDIAKRRDLGKRMLAKALHGLYSGHVTPFPYKVKTIHRLTGSTTKELSKFRQQLYGALAALEDVKASQESKIDNDDLVHIVPVLTSSQQRYLEKKHKREL